jgi:hypothetical protein
MVPATGDRKKAGMVYQFKMDEFMKSQPSENVQYLATLQQTQGLTSHIPYTSASLLTPKKRFQRIHS